MKTNLQLPAKREFRITSASSTRQYNTFNNDQKLNDKDLQKLSNALEALKSMENKDPEVLQIIKTLEELKQNQNFDPLIKNQSFNVSQVDSDDVYYDEEKDLKNNPPQIFINKQDDTVIDIKMELQKITQHLKEKYAELTDERLSLSKLHTNERQIQHINNETKNLNEILKELNKLINFETQDDPNNEKLESKKAIVDQAMEVLERKAFENIQTNAQEYGFLQNIREWRNKTRKILENIQSRYWHMSQLSASSKKSVKTVQQKKKTMVVQNLTIKALQNKMNRNEKKQYEKDVKTINQNFLFAPQSQCQEDRCKSNRTSRQNSPKTDTKQQNKKQFLKRSDFSTRNNNTALPTLNQNNNQGFIFQRKNFFIQKQQQKEEPKQNNQTKV